MRGLAEAGGGIRFWLDRLTQFIGLIGLSSLLVGGVGVGNAISSFLAGPAAHHRHPEVPGRARAAGLLDLFHPARGACRWSAWWLGLAIGAGLPFVAQSVIADVLPVRARVALYAGPLAIAAAFGLLVSLLFALMPLLRARRVSAATLMRGAVVHGGRLVWRDALLIGAVALALAAFTIFTADSRRIAGWFVLGAIGAFIAFPLLARLLMLAAARAGKPRLAGLRLALANLHRPGAPTPIVMLSLGLGLTVLVATALIEGNLREQLTRAHPERCAGLLLRRHPVDPDAGLREGARRHPGRGAARQGAVAARPHHQDRRQAGERDRRAAGRALGGRWRPRRHLFGDAARGLAHRRAASGGRPTIAGRSSSPSTRRWPRPSASASATPSR